MDYHNQLHTIIPELILASQSIARRSLLESYGCIVHVSPTHVDESHPSNVGLHVVQALAQRKLQHFLQEYPNPSLPVLTADTLISLDGKLVGKAEDARSAYDQIALFNGRAHAVCSGFALYLPASQEIEERVLSGSDEAIVTFAHMSDSEITQYIETGDWVGAAGSYRIQGEAKRFITNITGDITTVVGLPIQAISAILSSPTSL